MFAKPLLSIARFLLGLLLLIGSSHAYAECSGDLRKAAVFTQTNLDGVNTNRVVAYYRDPDGGLCEAGRYATGGAGSTAAFVNEGVNSVLLAGDCLLVANAGPRSLLDLNGSVSSFAIDADALRLVGQVPSRGLLPISVTVHGRNGYVVNNLGNSINAFSFDPATCVIAERPNSRRALGDPKIGLLGNPAQIQFTPDGQSLIVTDRQYPGVGLFRRYAIHVLAVGSDGLATTDTVNVSDGIMPYGFDFDAAGHLLVSNAGEPFLGLSSVTAYQVNADGRLAGLAGGQVRSGQSGACWVSYTRYTDRPIAYVMSLIDAVISSYAVADDGSLSLIDAAAARAGNLAFSGGLDIALSDVGPNDTAQYLYGINATPAGLVGVGTGVIVGYRVERNGALTPLGRPMLGPLPGFSGLAVR